MIFPIKQKKEPAPSCVNFIRCRTSYVRIGPFLSAGSSHCRRTAVALRDSTVNANGAVGAGTEEREDFVTSLNKKTTISHRTVRRTQAMTLIYIRALSLNTFVKF